MVKTKIIAAFPGTGKTYFTDQNVGLAIDSDSTHHSWMETEDGQKVRNPDFPSNYIRHFRALIGTAPTLFVSTHAAVRTAMSDIKMKFTLAYPKRELKHEYLERFKARGDTDGFIALMDTNWDSFIDEMETQKCSKRIVLSAGEYLSDHLTAQ